MSRPIKILHISDLHISSHIDSDGKKVESFHSWITTDPKDTNSENFVQEFCKYVKSKTSDAELFLIVTGDITDRGHPYEFTKAREVLTYILKELSIPLTHLLLIPGDHDINRSDIERAHQDGVADNLTKEPFEYQKEKLERFSTFYHEITNETFSGNNTLVKEISINGKILLIGLNSNYFIGNKGGNGGFKKNQLDSILEDANETHPEHQKIAVFHHNLFASHENKITGQWDDNNRIETINSFEKNLIKCVLYGNEHTPSSEHHDSCKITHSDAGAMASKSKPAPSFKIYNIVDDDNCVQFIPEIYICQVLGKNSTFSFGQWSKQNNTDLKEIEKIVLWQKNTIEIQETQLTEIEMPEPADFPAIQAPLKEEEEVKEEQYHSIYSEELYRIIREKKLFHSGHFHWSETSRAHNWIDVSKILEDYEDLLLAKKAVIDVIEEKKLEDKFDFVIGLGTEGNIISTRTALKFGKPYSYLPYSYRYDEHNDFEQKLNFTNEGKFKNVLIITDVVNDGRTIRKLVKKREEEFFSNVDRIFVIALIYTGYASEINSQILNSSKIENFDSENDEIVENIDFYSVLNIKVEKCPYDNAFRQNCLIYKDKLDCVHLFYDEIKAIKKIEL